MQVKKSLTVVLALLLLLTLTAGQGWTQDQAPAAVQSPMDTAFTYQGRLTDDGIPAEGRHDLTFHLYDAETLGNKIGPRIDYNGLYIRDGLFTVELDFGAGAFNGDARWLEIAVKPSLSGDPLEVLDPRQLLTAAPYAQFAETIYRRTVLVRPVGSELQNGAALLAALSDIVDASQSNPYLLAIEPGMYDIGTRHLEMKEYVDIQGAGVERTQIIGAGSPISATGTVVGADNAALRHLTVYNTGDHEDWATAIYNNDTAPHLQHVQALARDALSAIGVRNINSRTTMNKVTAVASGINFAAGIYTHDFSGPTMEDVTASGRDATRSYGLFNEDSYPNLQGVVAYAGSDTEAYAVYNVRCILSMIMDGVEAYAISATDTRGVFNDESNPEMRNVSIHVTGGDANYGLYNRDSSPVMNHVVTSAENGNDNYGLYNVNSSPQTNGITATASGGDNAYGVRNVDSDLTLAHVVATASGASSHNYGVTNSGSTVVLNSVVAAGRDGINMSVGVGGYDSHITLMNSTVTATGSGDTNVAMENLDTTAFINNSTLEASGATSENIGLDNGGSSGKFEVYVNNSQIRVPIADPTIRTDFEYTISLGASQLWGGDIDDALGGTLKCAGVYNEDYDFFPNTCP